MQLLGRPVNISRDQLNAWLSFRAPSAPKNFGAKIWDACANTQVNPALMACIALIKSKKFLNGQDIFACGIQGTLEDQIVNAVNRYAVMDPEELQLAQTQITSIELAYMHLQSWIRNQPEPKPEPKPEPVPPPKPEPVPPPAKKKNPHPSLVRFSVYLGIIGTAITAASLFFPQLKILAPIVALLKALLGAFGA